MAAELISTLNASLEVFMNRYLLSFYKKGNMRFISHLDLQTLFQRAIRRGNVKVAYSNGFNPHELMNIVQPLSLGYEGENELLEIDTEISYEPNSLLDALNLGLPDGIKFTSCKEVARKNKQTSISIEFAEYSFVYEDEIKLKLDEFLNQEEIIIKKHDKKTGGFVDKNIKDLICDIHYDNNKLYIKVCCGSNKTLNPSNLLTSLFEFSGLVFEPNKARITRLSLK